MCERNVISKTNIVKLLLNDTLVDNKQSQQCNVLTNERVSNCSHIALTDECVFVNITGELSPRMPAIPSNQCKLQLNSGKLRHFHVKKKEILEKP